VLKRDVVVIGSGLRASKIALRPLRWRPCRRPK